MGLLRWARSRKFGGNRGDGWDGTRADRALRRPNWDGGPMPGHDIIVVGGSARGLEGLLAIASGLPADLPAAVLVAIHTSPTSPGLLPEILARSGPLPAAQAADGEPVSPGRIYVAAPDHHLLLEPGRVRVTRGPKENRFRPAVDPLFRSAALAYGPRVVGVILSGGLDDGAAGLWAVKTRGGVAIVQDPERPRSARCRRRPFGGRASITASGSSTSQR